MSILPSTVRVYTAGAHRSVQPPVAMSRSAKESYHTVFIFILLSFGTNQVIIFQGLLVSFNFVLVLVVV